MRIVVTLVLLLAAACQRGPEAPTAAENEQLDEMEETLNAEANRSANCR